MKQRLINYIKFNIEENKTKKIDKNFYTDNYKYENLEISKYLCFIIKKDKLELEIFSVYEPILIEDNNLSIDEFFNELQKDIQSKYFKYSNCYNNGFFINLIIDDFIIDFKKYELNKKLQNKLIIKPETKRSNKI